MVIKRTIYTNNWNFKKNEKIKKQTFTFKKEDDFTISYITKFVLPPNMVTAGDIINNKDKLLNSVPRTITDYGTGIITPYNYILCKDAGGLENKRLNRYIYPNLSNSDDKFNELVMINQIISSNGTIVSTFRSIFKKIK